MKAYCITLNKTDPERALKAMAEIKRLGFEPEFSEGVNLKDHPLENLRPLLSPRAFVEVQKGRQVHEALSGMGSIGCYLAHYSLWQRCVELQEPIAIFEDDVIFTEEAPARLPEILREADVLHYDILRLIYVPQVEGERVSETFSRPVYGYSAAAYILQPNAAKLLVDNALPMVMHCDYYMDYIGQQYNLQQFFLNHAIHKHSALPSTIGHSQLIGTASGSPVEQCRSYILIWVSSLLLVMLLMAVIWLA